jgi:hydrogenase-1 operon protein HyaE
MPELATDATPAGSTPSAAPSATPTVAPPGHALLQRLVDAHGAQWVSLAGLDDWVKAAPGAAVLLVAGDAVRFPEGLDVAVVLPELRAAVKQAFRIGVATSTDEDAIASRFGAQRRPSLIFMRDGRYATTVAGMHDWGDYVGQVQVALEHPTGPAPLAIQALGGAASSCH